MSVHQSNLTFRIKWTFFRPFTLCLPPWAIGMLLGLLRCRAGAPSWLGTGFPTLQGCTGLLPSGRSVLQREGWCVPESLLLGKNGGFSPLCSTRVSKGVRECCRPALAALRPAKPLLPRAPQQHSPSNPACTPTSHPKELMMLVRWRWGGYWHACNKALDFFSLRTNQTNETICYPGDTPHCICWDVSTPGRGGSPVGHALHPWEPGQAPWPCAIPPWSWGSHKGKVGAPFPLPCMWGHF